MEYLPKLGERRAVLKHPLIPEPFIIELPELDFSCSVSEQEIQERMAPVLEQLRWVPRSYEEAPAVSGSSATANVAGDRKRNQSQEHRMAPLAKEALDYLEAVAKQPFMSATERDKKIGTSTYKGNRLRDQLVKEALVQIHHVNTGKKGGVITLVEITDKGWEVVKAYEMDVKKPIGKGSFIHQFWQHKVKEWFIENRRECKVEIEQSVQGKAVDVGAEIEGKKVAVEIMIKGEEKELTNIVKDIETGWDEVIVCSENNEMADSLRGRLEEIFGDRYKDLVRFKELREFVSQAKDIG